jgi:hypothetical protein
VRTRPIVLILLKLGKERDLPPISSTCDVLMLDPKYLPYRAQHLVLTTAQRLLEGSCFEFVMKWIPEISKEHMWDCPEALELNKWIRVLLKICNILPPRAYDNTAEQPFKSVLSSMIILRHSAVHRRRISTPEVAVMMQSATNFANALHDGRRAVQLNEIRKEILTQSKALAIAKASLQKRFAAEIGLLSDRRAELDRMEERSKVAMSKEDDENQLLIGDLLADAVSKVLHDIGSSGDNTSNSMCGGTAFDGTSLVGKPGSGRESEVGAGLNEHIREALTTEEPSSDEFSCDDATDETIHLAAES